MFERADINNNRQIDLKEFVGIINKDLANENDFESWFSMF
jgi:Ca2+-binding EF-hand superfamily protein